MSRNVIYQNDELKLFDLYQYVYCLTDREVIALDALLSILEQKHLPEQTRQDLAD